MIFDTHSHYNDKQFDADRAVVLESLKDAGVTQVVNVSASWKDLMDTLELISKVPFMYGAVGIHPDHVGELNEERMESFGNIVTGIKSWQSERLVLIITGM